MNNDTEGQLPEIIHIFSKRDRMGFEGHKRQVEVIEKLQEEGVIDRYFFVSSTTNFGIPELKKFLLDYIENTD